MSKIAEKIHNVSLQKAEEYSRTHGNSIVEEVAYGRGYKTAYIEAYDQAMQDIKEFIYDKFNIHPHDCHVVQYVSDTPLESIDDLVEHFKQYMEEEQ